MELGNDVRWKRMYRAAAAAALAMIGLVVLDMGISMALPAGDVNPADLTAADWLMRFHDRPLYALRDYGIFNIINNVLSIPVLLALYHIHRDRPLMLLAAVVAILGSGIYIANNTALPMLALSLDYAAATQAHRLTIEAAGAALLARGADFTLGTLTGTLLPSLGSLLTAFVVLTGNVFKRTVGYAGIAAYLLLSVFTVMTVFWPELFTAAMIIAMPGGLLVMVWNIALTCKFIKLSKI